jgi:hypothetical protein
MKRFLASLFVFATFCAVCLCASVRSDEGTVFVNEVPVVSFRTSLSGSSPAVRAKVLASGLAKAEGLDLTLVNATTASKIFNAGDLIAIIDKTEAAKHGSTMPGLASKWAKAIQSAWVLPPIAVDRSSVALRLGGTETVTLAGSSVRHAAIFLENADAVQVTRKGNELKIKGRAFGRAVVTVRQGDDAEQVVVRILPSAAALPQTVSASVVGAPAGSDTATGAAEAALRTKLRAEPGAKVEWDPIKVGDLPAGERRTYTVKVRVTAPDAFPAEGTVNLEVANLGLGSRRENELWYCNEPENVPGPQSLFLGNLVSDDPVRMLYHHINVSPTGLYFRVLATNDNDIAADLVIMPGDSKDKNPVLAGVRAADLFSRSWLTGSAEVVTIPPHTSIPIAFRRLAPQETSSGLCYLRLLPGGPHKLQVTAEALYPYALDNRWQAATQTPTPYRETGPVSDGPKFAAQLSPLIFPKPYKEEEFTYSAGGPFGFFRVGQKPIERRDPGAPLDGNFGVIYNITARAENPTGEPVNVELVYETSAGYSGGIFSVNGEVVRLPLMQSKAEAKLAAFTLNPGESKTINVITLPLSGSSYPVTLALRPVIKIAEIK